MHTGKNPTIVLASKSKARRKLMKELQIPFIATESQYEEDMSAIADPIKLAEFLAQEKARFIAKKHSSSLIIGADTFITIGKEKIGKPKNVNDAKRIIKKMSNNAISVITGIAIVKTDTTGNIIEEKKDHAITEIIFSKITNKDIDEIIEKDEILSISGAFTIEGHGGTFVKKIKGDYQNVIGLPLNKLKPLLLQMLTDKTSEVDVKRIKTSE
jgi:septum formation protein